MLRKLLFIMAAVALISTPAFAGNRPEFDAVGCDNYNFFNGAVEFGVIANNIDGFGNPIEFLSDFGEYYAADGSLIYDPFEYFSNSAGQLYPDPCFPGYVSALTDTYNEAIYEWQIVLQMKPESDLNLDIRDCVLKHNEMDPYMSAEQTGRYRAPNGQLMFVPTANPIVTVTAIPGIFATPGFVTPFIMDARTLPGLFDEPLDEAVYTSKALWQESLVMVLPATGNTNMEGQTVYNLKQGDAINVKVQIPGLNTADIRYGQDNVILKYIGIVGTEYDGYYHICQE